MERRRMRDEGRMDQAYASRCGEDGFSRLVVSRLVAVHFQVGEKNGAMWASHDSPLLGSEGDEIGRGITRMNADRRFQQPLYGSIGVERFIRE